MIKWFQNLVNGVVRNYKTSRQELVSFLQTTWDWWLAKGWYKLGRAMNHMVEDSVSNIYWLILCFGGTLRYFIYICWRKINCLLVFSLPLNSAGYSSPSGFNDWSLPPPIPLFILGSIQWAREPLPIFSNFS